MHLSQIYIKVNQSVSDIINSNAKSFVAIPEVCN